MKLKIQLIALFTIIASASAFAQEVVELKMPKSNKVVIELMFRNGSICDPAGKEGLTQLTTSVMSEGGTGTMTASDITDKIYPGAAGFGGSAEKEVSVLTFEVPSDFLAPFWETVKGII